MKHPRTKRTVLIISLIVVILLLVGMVALNFLSDSFFVWEDRIEPEYSENDNLTVENIVEITDVNLSFEDVAETVNDVIVENTDESLPIESDEIIANSTSYFGLNFSIIADSELEKYIDFTVPYEWTVEKINSNTEVDEEVWRLGNECEEMNIYLKSFSTAKDIDSVKEECSLMKASITNGLGINDSIDINVCGNYIAYFCVNYDENTTLYYATIGAKEKTIAIEYICDNSAKQNDINYFLSIINEISMK